MIGLRALSNGRHTLEHPDGLMTVRVMNGAISYAELNGKRKLEWPVFEPIARPTVQGRIIQLHPGVVA